MNCAESEAREVLGPAGNKTTPINNNTRSQVSKPLRKVEKTKELNDVKTKKVVVNTMGASQCFTSPPVVKQHEHKLLRSNLSLNASCSSDASTDSWHSRASTGRLKSLTPTAMRRKQNSPKSEKFDKLIADADSSPVKRRCAWVTPNTDPCYSAFHDEEWGVPVHDDKRLFELLSFSTALAELTWPAILNKRHAFREVFVEFDPNAVSKINEKKFVMAGCPANSLLSELKLRCIIENARQMCKIIEEFGTFDKYIWGFINNKTIVGQFRYARQVPIKTSKADAISKDLVRRGFRGVGPTAVYSFMQCCGMTNDHLIGCFRFHDCINNNSNLIAAAAAAAVCDEEDKKKKTIKNEEIDDQEEEEEAKRSEQVVEEEDPLELLGLV
ncbi:uncharacterized protein LOC124910654 [Impatiens glandulifera]|uniref:uncharacterized protein LOC124910654 n=1 Tax=Impatiens glandulifera TaxID=253017 RepID=UPI001FB0CF63|nr:uncharacterized protein LOC124910654 [Impatiens glandulifera]